MFRLQLPFRQLRAAAGEAQQRMVRDRSELLHSMGARLVRLVKESFLTRARGGIAAGIQWEPLTESRKKAKRRQGQSTEIGIATGELVESAGYEIVGDEISVDFHAPHTFAFEELRPLMPEQLPEEWQEELEDLAYDWGEDILIETVEEADF